MELNVEIDDLSAQNSECSHSFVQRVVAKLRERRGKNESKMDWVKNILN